MSFLKSIPSSQSDEELVSSYKATADLAVLAGLYQRYMELVYGVCLKYLPNEDDARDAVLSIYEELIVKLKKYEVHNFRPWLHQLAKNYCLMQLRSGKNRRTTTFEPEFMYLEDNFHLDDVLRKETRLQAMEDCLTRLNEEQKRAVGLFYLESRCYKSIAVLMELELNKVRSLIQNGKRNLKICMEENILESDS